MRNWRRWARFGDAARPGSASVRLRLTFLYTGLFLLSGVVLLAITYLLVRNASTTTSRHALMTATGPRPVGPAEQHSLDLHNQLVASIVALGVMTLISAGLGWLVAGRVLAPIRTMTRAARRISQDNLAERLDVRGPNDELKLLGDTIDELLARLEAAFDAQRRFVANASHEMRTPLTVMRTTLEVAAAKPNGVPPELKVLEAALIEDLDHAERLLESFLVLSRAEHGELGEQSPVSLTDLISDCLAAQAHEITSKEIEVRTALTADARVIGSETLLARMVGNVIENAVRHNEQHGVIEVACELDGDHAWLLIDSTGPLLDEDRVRQLAQPFKRLGRDRTGSHRGHGLGLSIVAAIATAHHGRLELQARPQGGLSVRIRLPTTKAVEIAAGPA
jgi:signal transduction histidine kinase